jgi:putative DNA methylase
MPTKKLIEVALPLDAINEASVRENYIYKGNPSAIHKWWAQRPLAACRAVLFAQLVDDPSSHPETFPTEQAQQKERQRLFGIIERLVVWENSNSEQILAEAKAEIAKSTNGNLPSIYDPFAGGSSIPLEAQRLGLEVHASDLNPVAVLINKALIEFPAIFADLPPINPEDSSRIATSWKGTAGLAADVRYYGKWMRDEAQKRIGHFYPKVKTPKEYGGGESTAIAWLWVRTVNCPNPACGARMPLMSSFAISTRKGKEVYAHPMLDYSNRTIRFEIRHEPFSMKGTSDRSGATCLFCKSKVNKVALREISLTHGVQEMPVAAVCDTSKGRYYVSMSEIDIPNIDRPQLDEIDHPLPEDRRWFSPPLYGFPNYSDLFTNRQLLALRTLTDLIRDVRTHIEQDITAMRSTRINPDEMEQYINAIATYLAFACDKYALYGCSFVRWYAKEDRPLMLFDRQAIPMIWDFPEINPFSEVGGSFYKSVLIVADSIPSLYNPIIGKVSQTSATDIPTDTKRVFATDPPYYDNIGYADLSDFFFVWLKKSLGGIYPLLFSTLLTPKSEEMIAAKHRFEGSREKANAFFESSLIKSFSKARIAQDENYPLTVYYAFKQGETESLTENPDDNTSRIPSENVSASTGWEKMLEGIIQAGFAINGTWPLRTERSGRMIEVGTNALASSIVLVCRPRPEDARSTTRLEFIRAMRRELPGALRALQSANIAPVDLAQAAIGPGMAIYSRYKAVLEADGTPMRVRTALQLINQALDEVLAEQEGEYDGDTRWAIAWFEQSAFDEGLYGVAETLSKAKNTSVAGMVEAGVVVARGGKVRLLSRDELPANWNPAKDTRVTAWEATQHLVRALDKHGESGAATLLAALPGGVADQARDLAYRLYTTCERKKWAQEALAYNSLVIAWPEIAKLAVQRAEDGGPVQGRMEL